MKVSDVVTKRSPALLALFGFYVERFLRKNFHAIRISNLEYKNSEDQPIVAYTNHPSWWDPLLFIFMDKKIFLNRISYGPMDKKALENYDFMRRLGIFGIEQDSFKGSKDFLNICQQLLIRKSTMLWITAQGGFFDPRERPILLQTGIAHLVKKYPDAIFLPIAFEYPFWNERYPEVLIHIGKKLDTDYLKNKTIEKIQQSLQLNLTNCMNELAELAISRNEKNFRLLLSGNKGIGGVYDSFKKIKSKITGQAYQSEHSAIDHDRNNINN